jgi:hypothetical protein
MRSLYLLAAPSTPEEARLYRMIRMNEFPISKIIRLSDRV